MTEGPLDMWEYGYVQVGTNTPKQLSEALNDLGCEGWEVVAVTYADRTVGMNSVLATVKRRMVPFDPPPYTGEGWCVDPSGRFDKRFWNGRAWTFHVGRETDKSTHRDPPTRLVPHPAMHQ